PDSREGKPGTALGRSARGRDPIRRLRPLALFAGAKVARDGRFWKGLGRHFVVAVRLGGGLDRGTPPRHRIRSPFPLDVARTGRLLRPARTKGQNRAKF